MKNREKQNRELAKQLVDLWLENGTVQLMRGIKELERRAIQRTLAQHDYNISKAGKALGLSRSTLSAKIKRFKRDIK